MDFTKGSEVVPRAGVEALLKSVWPDATVDEEFDEFTQPDKEMFRWLDAKYWDERKVRYGSNSPKFPNCYDIAIQYVATMQKAAELEGFKVRFALGVLRYTKSTFQIIDGEKVYDRHAIAFIAYNNCHIEYREPQPSDAPWMDQPRDCVSVEDLDA